MAAGRSGSATLATSLQARLKSYGRNQLTYAGSEVPSEPASL